MEATGQQAPLPEYICHKRVRAAKITNIERGSVVTLTLEGTNVPRHVVIEWVMKHSPEVGGYFVEYADGYQSYSPAKAFEEGYTPANPNTLGNVWATDVSVATVLAWLTGDVTQEQRDWFRERYAAMLEAIRCVL